MTWPSREPIRPEPYTAVAANGCTEPGCGTQNTLILSARDGRRCAAHAEDIPADLLEENDRD